MIHYTEIVIYQRNCLVTLCLIFIYYPATGQSTALKKGVLCLGLMMVLGYSRQQIKLYCTLVLYSGTLRATVR